MKTIITALFIGLFSSSIAARAEQPLEPAKFAPEAAADAILNICASGGYSVAQTAIELGLKEKKAEKSIAWALSADAQVWEINSRDGEVLLFAYGPQQMRCGVIINSNIPFEGRYTVSKELATTSDYTVLNESEISSGVYFIRMFDETTERYIDIVDYPGSRSSPGLIKVELLAN